MFVQDKLSDFYKHVKDKTGMYTVVNWGWSQIHVKIFFLKSCKKKFYGQK